MTNTIKILKTSIILLVIFLIITGLLYPLLVTGVGQLFFPWRVNGSLLREKNKIIASLLIGQSFTETNYFWGRPSATEIYPYNAEYSGGSNLALSNPKLLHAVEMRLRTLQQFNLQTSNNYSSVPITQTTNAVLQPQKNNERKMDGLDKSARVVREQSKEIPGRITANYDDMTTHLSQHTLIPGDLVMASASGLDPDISPLAAYYQISRIAKARNMSEKTLRELIQKYIQRRTFGILGEPRVNVLELNLALDQCIYSPKF